MAKSGIIGKAVKAFLTKKWSAPLFCLGFLVLYFSSVGSLYAAGQKNYGANEITDDLATGAAGGVNLIFGSNELSGSLGQSCADTAAWGAGGGLESGYFAKMVSSPSAAGYTQVFITSITVQWADSSPSNPQATLYTAEVSTAADFTGVVIIASSTTSPISITGLAGGTTYYGRVRANYMEGDESGYYVITGGTQTLDSMSGICPAGFDVKQDGTADYTAIQPAVDALSHNLTSDACIVIRDIAAYGEQVTVRGFITNGYRLRIMAAPGFVNMAPVITPPAGSTAAFVIANDSITITGIDVLAANAMPYGILVSSANIAVSTVNIAGGSYINIAGISLSSWSSISDSSITVQGARGVQILGGAMNVLSHIMAQTGDQTALYLQGASSNTITQSYFYSPSGHGAQLLNNSWHNTISFSSISINSTLMALDIDNSSFNTVTGCSVFNPAGYGAFVGFDADNNMISSSTISSNAAGYFAIKLESVSSNTITNSFVSNPAGVAFTSLSGSGNVLDQSTVTSNSWAYNSVFLDGTLSDTLSNSYVSGANAVYVRGSTGTAVFSNILVATNTAGEGLYLETSRDVDISSNTISGGGQGKGIYLVGNSGVVSFSSNTIKASNTGLSIAAQQAGANLQITTMTFTASPPNTTAVYFAGGTLVSTFSYLNFADMNIVVNVDAGLMGAGSRITMLVPSGAKAGALYENDSNGYVDWSDFTPPTVFIATPSNNAYHNSLPAISGAAADDVAVSSVQITIRRLSDDYYWNGGVMSGSQVWLDCGLEASSWTYANVPSWVTGSSYTVVAKAKDTSDNWSVEYSTSVFTYDATGPASKITAPQNLSVLKALAAITGTAQDSLSGIAGAAQITVSIQEVSQGNAYWNGVIPGTFTAVSETFYPLSGLGGTYDGNNWSVGVPVFRNGYSYRVKVRATDSSLPVGNVEADISSVTFAYDTTPPDAVITYPRSLPDPGANLKTLTTVNGTAYELFAIKSASVSFQESDTLLYYDSQSSTFNSITQKWLGANISGSAPDYAWSAEAPNFMDNRSYNLRVIAEDMAGNVLTPPAPSVIRYDVTAPVSRVSSPAEGGFVRTLASVGGTSQDQNSDPSGINGSQIKVQRAADLNYWNGSAWAVQETWLDPVSGSPWSKTTQLPPSDNSTGFQDGLLYILRSRAYDVAGNTQSVILSGNSFRFDVSSPVVSVIQPLGDGRFNSLPVIAGSAGDSFNVRYPQVRIYDIALNKYWLGGAGFCGSAVLPGWVGAADACPDFPEIWNVASDSSSVGEIFSWNYDSSGVVWPDRDEQLRVDVKAMDEAGNYGLAGSTFSFDNSAPVSGFVYPPSSALAYSSMTAISGTSRDLTSPVSSVTIKMWYISAGTTYYWEPALPHWGITDAGWWLIAGASGPKSVVNPWSYTNSDFTNPGTLNYAWKEGTHDGLSGKTFFIAAKAVDAAGNEEINYSTRTFSFDDEPPTVVILHPVDSFSSNSLIAISGTAADIIAVSSAQIYIQKSSENYYWNGSSFAAPQAWLDCALSASQWNYDSSAVSWVHGSTYTIVAKARDTVGNWSAVYSTSVYHYYTAPASGTVSNIIGTVLGSTSFYWAWSAGSMLPSDGYGIFSSSGVAIATVAFSSAGSSYTQTGLSPNMPVSVKIGGYTAGGYGGLVQSSTYYTFAAAPGASVIGARTPSSIVIDWPPNGNPEPGTAYQLWRDISAAFSQPAVSIAAVSSHTASGLAADTVYYFKVRSINGAGVYSDFSAPVSTATMPAIPVQPSAPAGSALGVSSITWAWAAVGGASGYTVYPATSPASLIGAPVSALFIQTGLSKNTTYSIVAAGVNVSGEGPASPAAAAVATLADIPSAVTASAVYATSATINWALNGNPSGTTAKVMRFNTGTTFTISNTSYTDTGLLGCTSYYFRVWNVNRDNIATEYVALGPLFTANPTPLSPGNLSAESLPGNRVALTWEPAPFEGITEYRLYYDNGSGAIDYGTPLAVLSAGQTAYTTGVLVSSAAYKFSVRAKHRCGVLETNTGMVAMAASLSNLSGARASIKIPQTGKKVSGNSITVMAELILKTAVEIRQVLFQYKPSASGTWLDMSAANANHPNPDVASPYFIHWDVTVLAAGNYDMRAVAADLNNIADADPPAITINIDPVNADITENISGGKITKEQKVYNLVANILQTGDAVSAQVTKLEIPAGALDDSTATVSVTNNPALAPPAPANAAGVGVGAEITFSNSQTLLAGGRTAAVTLIFPDSNDDGIVDGTAMLAHKLEMYSAANMSGRWQRDVNFNMDLAGKKVTGYTAHFSFFALLAPLAVDLNAAKAYPVPWKPGSGGRFDSVAGTDGMVFDNLTDITEIRIYTITGQLVRELELTAADHGFKVWDGKNSAGRKVGSGVYLIHIKSDNSKKILKIAVER
ncbi:MAG: hypothetical protein A2270_01755 [Elusimicrobia bacterium RIFOXYA12_FULL_51_18]|nr:MAG: hypothetical protein A2270_01755 [Elusimicrobia bacterium RIFOXYA12_FULL_51_18]OGS28609.1 MAG: hypothetical protein A2218_07325 [Elusimicrobia bacterium RIFOXYA2_FULL_53_38]